MDTEEALVQAAKSGDAAAFGTLIERHQPVVAGLLVGLLGNLADAEEAAQQAFVKAFESLGSFEGRSGFRTWVTRIAINEARSLRRRRRLWGWLPGSGEGEDARPATEAAAPDEREAAEKRLELDRALDALGPREREIAGLRLEGYALGEIAEVLGISEGTVKSTLHDATQKMRKALG